MTTSPKKGRIKQRVAVPQDGGELAFGGGLEGAERTKRETVMWTPSMASPDKIVNGGKTMSDARSRDMALNDGYTQGAVRIKKDSIIGSMYRLNAKPNYRVICGTDAQWAKDWADDLAATAEARAKTVGLTLLAS